MDDQMLVRVCALETDMVAVKTDVAVIRSNHATKEDLSNLENRLLKWFVATAASMALVSFSAVLAVARMLT